MRQLPIQTLYYLIYSGARKEFCKFMQCMEIWFVLWNGNASFCGIIVMCGTKFLNK